MRRAKLNSYSYLEVYSNEQGYWIDMVKSANFCVRFLRYVLFLFFLFFRRDSVFFFILLWRYLILVSFWFLVAWAWLGLRLVFLLVRIPSSSVSQGDLCSSPSCCLLTALQATVFSGIFTQFGSNLFCSALTDSVFSAFAWQGLTLWAPTVLYLLLSFANLCCSTEADPGLQNSG